MVIDPTTPTRDINRRLMLSLHQDGLFDILAGLIIITFGMIPILDASGMGAGARQIIFLSAYGLEVLLIFWLKKRLTLPRSGLVVLSPKTSRKISMTLLLVNLVIFIFFIVNYAFDLEIFQFFGQYRLSILLGLVFFVIITLTGALLVCPRYYVYAVLVFASFVVSEHFYILDKTIHHGIPVAACFSGGIMILVGIILLIRFIKTYKLDN